MLDCSVRHIDGKYFVYDRDGNCVSRPLSDWDLAYIFAKEYDPRKHKTPDTRNMSVKQDVAKLDVIRANANAQAGARRHATEVVNNAQRHGRKGNAVRIVETGEVFKSQLQAAEFLKVSAKLVHRAVHKGCAVAGVHVVYV